MKNIILRRFFPTFLCMALALILTSCDGKDQQPVESGTGSTVRTPSVSKEEGSSSERAVPLSKDKKDKSASNSESQKEDEPAPVVYSEAAQGSLALLRDSMSCSEQIAGAVAYLGYRAQGDSTPLGEWILGNCSALADDMPFLLEIPDNCILGVGYGDLYCIVPRDENTSLAVNRVKWESLENGVWPVAEEILYREEYAQPVLVFVNFEQWSDESDTEIILVTNDGVEVSWCPQIDEYGFPIVPTGQDDIPMLVDFAIWGYTTGLDYPAGWEPSENQDPSGDWYLPPTDWGLADTSWTCEHWFMDLNWGDSNPDYSGTAQLYYRNEEIQEYELAYFGVWRMEDDCLHLEISDGEGGYMEGRFPVLIDPSGENLHIQQDRETGVVPPFFGEDMSCTDLTLVYG